MNRRRKQIWKSEKGEIMLEAIMTVIPTIFVLIFLLSLGFLLYQQWTVQYLADELASKISINYKYVDMDVKTGELRPEDVKGLALYKYRKSNSYAFRVANQKKAQEYGNSLSKLTGYGSGVGQEIIDLKLVNDSLGRRHINIKVKGTYRIPFSEGLEVFGMNGTQTFTATSSAECVDVSDYFSSIEFKKQNGKILSGDSKILEMINTWIGIFKTIKDSF